MHNFGEISLVGVEGVFKKATFYQPNATKPTRTFLCQSGPGCTQDLKGRKISGRWVNDNMPDTISSYDLEVVIVAGKEIKPIDTGGAEFLPDDTPVLVSPESVTPESESHPRGRVAWKPMEAETPAAVVTNVVEGVVIAAKLADMGHRHPAPAQPAPVNGTLLTAKEAGLDLAEKTDFTVEPFSPARAVAMYLTGMKLPDIAARFGDREKRERIRIACREAGVYNGVKEKAAAKTKVIA